eukprot:3396252-Pyramimonas_sp.AAC.1
MSPFIRWLDARLANGSGGFVYPELRSPTGSKPGRKYRTIFLGPPEIHDSPRPEWRTWRSCFSWDWRRRNRETGNE